MLEALVAFDISRPCGLEEILKMCFKCNECCGVCLSLIWKTKDSCSFICSKFIRTVLTPRLTDEALATSPMESLHRPRCFYSNLVVPSLSPQMTH